MDWDKLVDTWKKNQWTDKPGSPLQKLQHGKIRDEQKEIVKQRISDCMHEYNVSVDEAKGMLYKVLVLASDTSDKNYLRSSEFGSKVNFKWLIQNRKNFFDVLDGNYLKK